MKMSDFSDQEKIGYFVAKSYVFKYLQNRDIYPAQNIKRDQERG